MTKGKRPKPQAGSGAARGGQPSTSGAPKQPQRQQDAKKRKGPPAPQRQEGAAKRPKLAEVAARVETHTELPRDPKAVSSNWSSLKSLIAKPSLGAKPRTRNPAPGFGAAGAGTAGQGPKQLSENREVTHVLAIDCEMVGTGPEGDKSMLARVVIINDQGNVLLDSFVKPTAKVTDYR